MRKGKLLKGAKKIHFIGVCGYIMSAMAVMLREIGYEISGSDQNAYPPATDIVDRAGIKRFEKHSPENIGDPDLVVVGNHINEENIEAQAAIKRKLPVTSLPELIGEIFANKKRIVVGGTHGKTTTTSLIAWILEEAGLKPSYLIGGVIQGWTRGFKLGKGGYFVVEGDEYRTAFFDQRPKFFHYHPDIAVLTTCEFDHPDYFADFAEIKKVFKEFINLVPSRGLIVGGIDDPDVAKILKQSKRPKVSCGLGKMADYQGFDMRFGETTKFKVKKRSRFLADFQTRLPGVIGVQDSLLAIAIADHLKIDIKKIQRELVTFRGAKRRFEIMGEPKGILVIDDYAHHPTKIQKTLAAARSRYPQKRIYCVFEPHTYSRTKALLKDYGRAFSDADEIIIAKLMPAREAGQKPTVNSQDVVEEIKKHHPKVKLIPESADILKYFVSKAERGNVLIVMSVGGLDNLAKRLVERIKKGKS